MPKFQKYLRHIDMLVTPYEFNVTKSQKSLTKLGGFFSIAILILMIVYTISIFISTMSKAGSIYAGTQTFSEIESLDQNSSFFILQLSFAQSGEIIPYDQNLTSYFSFNIQYVNQVRPENTTQYIRKYQNLSHTICSQQMIDKFNFYNQYPSQEQSKKYICFYGDYQLSGSFFEPLYNYIRISLNKCQNQPNCKSDEDLSNFIDQSINVNLFILDSKIKQTLNMTEPSQESAYIIFWRLTSGIANSEDVFLQPILVDLVNNKNILNSLQGEQDLRSRIFRSSRVEKSERRQYPIDLKTDSNLCTFYLRTSSDSQYFFAQKTEAVSVLLDAISQASGLAVAILGLAKILYKIYIEHETYIKVMNQVFKFDLRESSAIRDNQSINGSFTTDKSQRIDQIYENQLQYSFLTYLQIKASKFFRELFMFKYCCKKNYEKKVIMAQMAKSKIMSDLELSNIVKKLYEIDCLKLLLFDDDQLKLFNSFSQPVFQKNMIAQKQILKLITRDYQRSMMKGSVLEKYQLNNQKSQNIDVQEAFQSETPIELQLSKLSRFFKAQIKAQNGEELLQAYSKVFLGKNQNQKMNEQLLNFIKYNQILFQAVDFTHKKNSVHNLDGCNEIPKITKAKSQYSKYYQSQDLDLGQEQGKISIDAISPISQQSFQKRGYISQNKGDHQVDQKDFDEINEFKDIIGISVEERQET